MTNPGTIIGYRKNGTPIRLIAGGSEPTPPGLQPVAPPVAQPVIPVAPPEQYFTVAQLEAARQQEKDKVYGRMTAAEELARAMQAEVETLKAKQAEYDAEKKRVQDELDAAKKKADEEKMTASELIAAREKEFAERQAQFERQMMTRQAELEKEQQYLSLRDYISRRVNEEVAQDNIAPEFLDYITGNTEAEVEASITKAKDKTASIAGAKANILGTQAPSLPGVSPTGFGPTGPLEQFTGQQQELTPEQIGALSMAEYAQYRAARGIDKAGKDRGMFG